MSTEISRDHRRRFLFSAVLTVAAVRLGRIGPAGAQSRTAADLPAIRPGTNTSFASLKQIDAGVLNVGMPKPVPPAAPLSSFCTAGLTTSTAMSMLPRCWRRPATG